MGFDKFVEKSTLVDTALLTIVWIIVADCSLWNAFCLLLTLPVVGIAVIAIYQMRTEQYRILQDVMKDEKRLDYVNWEILLKEERRKHVYSLVLVIIWNIATWILIILSLMVKYNGGHVRLIA